MNLGRGHNLAQNKNNMGFGWLWLGYMIHSEGRAESEGRLLLSGNQILIIKMQKNGCWVEKILLTGMLSLV